ncbi:hypothetical protein ONS95_001007 [Cadophora gregata]|uniref:uncharacterized protein n=1 Tax=Cadophora gregata TaxID=51156 RepID=UPI0026DD9CD0|nr:uncharacterized protein ONS95_001007 [Cadophora gregata]KAK0102198.1 hypothetical protein ONS96_006159 [Cadophora gregata f. sp. sojae]KAK0129066.1 hypothetical protein ONS95_001007 [Cadophora gregata]
MFSKTLITALTVGLVAFSNASPLVKRATTVSSDTGDASITPAITTEPVSFPDDVGGKVDAAGAVADVVNKVVQLVQGLVDDDIKRRQRFTQETVASVINQFPTKNVVMSNVGYSISCTPDVVSSTSYKAKVGSNVSYDVLVFGSGCTFELQGDGGFENWAYIRQASCTGTGKSFTC